MVALLIEPDAPSWLARFRDRILDALRDRPDGPSRLYRVADAAHLPDATKWPGAIMYETDLGVVRSDGTSWRGIAAAGGGTSVIDFGAFPGASDASLAVSAPGITAGANVTATILANASADHTADEHRVEEIDVCAGSVTAGVGFTLYAKTRNTLLYGKWNVAWSFA